MATEARPAFYALAEGGWRDYITLLHVPYSAWHLSYVAIGAALTPEFALDRLADVEQLLGAELGLDAQAGVQEVGLVEQLALGRGLVDRGRGEHLDPSPAERRARVTQVGLPVPDVRAEAEVAGLQTSFHTSTETSSTGSGIGGSGLVAFTRTDSAPKRSIRRSATAVQSRSSVL